MLRERYRKIKNLSEENDRLKKSVDDMKMEIDQLDAINKDLYMHNNRLTELQSGRKRSNTEVETGGEEGEDGEREEIDETKEHGRQVKGRTTNKQTKCYFYENTKCMKENCKLRHLEIECEDFKKNK